MSKKLEEQVSENTMMLKVLEKDITTIKDNHLHHLEKDVASLHKKVEKIDARIWWVLGLLVASGILGMLKGG
jgi:hypothetical protein|tara:strand:+ start:2431 stop:2646 length:216 start_codon:yes stop_codon:yes gene_type:complete